MRKIALLAILLVGAVACGTDVAATEKQDSPLLQTADSQSAPEELQTRISLLEGCVTSLAFVATVHGHSRRGLGGDEYVAEPVFQRQLGSGLTFIAQDEQSLWDVITVGCSDVIDVGLLADYSDYAFAADRSKKSDKNIYGDLARNEIRSLLDE